MPTIFFWVDRGPPQSARTFFDGFHGSFEHAFSSILLSDEIFRIVFFLYLTRDMMKKCSSSTFNIPLVFLYFHVVLFFFIDNEWNVFQFLISQFSFSANYYCFFFCLSTFSLFYRRYCALNLAFALIRMHTIPPFKRTRRRELFILFSSILFSIDPNGFRWLIFQNNRSWFANESGKWNKHISILLFECFH